MNSSLLPRTARLLFWSALAFASVMAFLPKPPKLPSHDWGDKWEHAAAFLVLTALAQAGFGRAARWRVLAAMVAYGALIEVVQMIPVLNRSADVRDWLVDSVVALIVTGAALVVDRWTLRNTRG
jgi:VanZ family protein